MAEEADTLEIHWSNRPQGNKYSQKLHPAMQLEGGYKVLTQILLQSKGRQRSESNEKTWVRIIYDESYITAKIIHEFLKPLNPKDYRHFQHLASKAWQLFSESKEGAKTNE